MIGTHKEVYTNLEFYFFILKPDKSCPIVSIISAVSLIKQVMYSVTFFGKIVESDK